jgi:hypothetical protein
LSTATYFDELQVFGRAPIGTHWSYTTVLADARELLPVAGCAESAELRWVAEHQVADLRLHPGLADSWRQLREMPAPTVASEFRVQAASRR